MKNDKEVMQALIDGKMLKYGEHFIHINYSGNIVNEHCVIVPLNKHPSEYSIYEPPKEKKKYVLYRHYYLNTNEKMIFLDTNKTWEDLSWAGAKLLETEIIKEIEV